MLVLWLMCVLGAHSARAAISYVQGNSTAIGGWSPTVNVSLRSAQNIGDLIVVAVGWSDGLPHTCVVTDSSGNHYTVAVGPTLQVNTGREGQYIFYAKDIAAAGAGANTVTVTFDSGALYPDVRVAEYGGVDTSNPVDVVVAGAGTSVLADSGPLTTSSAHDLLVAADTVWEWTTGAGDGYTQRLLSSNGAQLEDRLTSVGGSYNATAPISASDGDWVIQLVAFRAATGTPSPRPTAPGSMTAAATSSAGMTLSWTASSESGGTITQYVVERCQGSGCSNFARIGTAIGTSYNDLGLVASTSYSYRVQAADANDTYSVYSNISSASTRAPQTTATVSYVQGNSAIVSNSSATVNVSLPNAQNAGDLIAVAVGWSDDLPHTATVTDVSGNTYTNAVGPTLRVNTGHVGQDIFYAKNVAVAGAGANTVTVTFDQAASYPDVRVAEYSGVDTANPVDAVLARAGTSTLADTGSLITSNTTDLLVAADTVWALTAGPGSGYVQRLLSDNGAILEDRMTSAGGSYNATAPLSAPDNDWVIQIVAFKAANSAPSPRPIAPSSLVVAASSSTQTTLSWSASNESGGSITQYLMERCQGAGCSNFAQLGTTTATTFNDINLAASTSYSYRVRATDAGGNFTAYSSVASAMTPSGGGSGDTQPPSTPTELITAPASGSAITLTWSASTDNAGVTGYLIEECLGSGCTNFTQVGTSTGTSFTITGLAASTTYNFRVRAIDAAGNDSGYSTIVSAATLASSAICD